MIHKFKALAALTLITFQSLSYATSNPQIDNLAQAFMKKDNVPGLSIAVIDQGKISLFNYGYADEVKKSPTTSNTIYTIASFSKTYTATLSAIAAVQGKLNLNAPFNQYIPELKNNATLAVITPSMLLGHVASLPFNFSPPPTSYTEAMTDVNQFVPANPPGSQFQYSNVSIGLMGYVLQNIYGQNYETLLAEEITQPLGMTSTYLNLPADKLQYVALGHDENGVHPYDPSIDVWFAAASLKSTISDMAKYLNAQINPASLSDTTLAQAINLVHQNKYCFANKQACEQLAWQAHVMSDLNNSDDDTFYSVDSQGNLSFGTQKIINNPDFSKKYFIDKTGSGWGESSYMAYIPDEKLGVVILLNRSYFADKSMGNQRIKLGRDILKSLEQD